MRWLRRGLQVGALAAAYVIAGMAGFAFAAAHAVVSSAWPPVGVAVAALLLWGPRLWPGVWLGALVVNLLGGEPLAAAAVIASGNTMGPLAAVFVMRWLGFRPGLERLRDALLLIGVAALGSTLLNAVVGANALWLLSDATRADVGRLLVVWWFGDGLGVLVVTPLILMWARGSPVRTIPSRGEFAITLTVLASLSVFLFFGTQQYAYAVFPVTGWLALRSGPRAVVVGTLLVAAIAAVATTLGRGPFGGPEPTEALFLLQLFIGLLAAKGLVLSSLWAERRVGETALRHREMELAAAYQQAMAATRRSRAMFDAAPIAILLVDDGGRIQEWNGEAERLFGWSAAGAVGRVCPSVPEDLLEDFHAMIGRAFAGTASRGLVRPRRRADGTIIHARINCAPVRDADGTIVSALVMLEDITGQLRMQRELSASRDSLVELSRRVLEAQEQERRAVARELHDEIGQVLTSIRMSLRAVASDWPGAPPAALDDSVGMVDSGIETVRALSQTLRPAALDELGLSAALNALVRRMADTAGLKATFDSQLGTRRLAPPVESTAFRVVQEALTNVVRHAGATRVAVSVRCTASELEIEVEDDGRGFTLEPGLGGTGTGFGLVSMRERITLLGGRLELDAAEGEGTAVRAWLPITGGGA